MNTLFGIYDNSCIKRTIQLIKTVEDSGLNTLYIIKAQTIVVKTALEKIGNTINQTNEM